MMNKIGLLIWQEEQLTSIDWNCKFSLKHDCISGLVVQFLRACWMNSWEPVEHHNRIDDSIARKQSIVDWKTRVVFTSSCWMVKSRNVRSLRTEMTLFGPWQPILVPRPPLSLTTINLFKISLGSSIFSSSNLSYGITLKKRFHFESNQSFSFLVYCIFRWWLNLLPIDRRNIDTFE